MKKQIALLTVLLLSLNAFYASTISSFGTEGKHFYPVRERMSVQTLNGTWKFKIVEGTSIPDELADWNTPSHNTSQWDDITVPGNWETQGFKIPEYGDMLGEYTGLYSRTFSYNPAWQGKHVILRLDGVHFGYECYINGHKAGEWGSAFNLCQFDITPYLDTKGKNLICMKVTTRTMGWRFDENDCWSLAGITRDIELFPLDNIYLEDVKYISEVDANLNATIHMNVNIGYFTKDENAYSLNIAISNPQNHHVLDFKTPIKKEVNAYEFTDKIISPKLWTAETPNLYRMEVCIADRQGNIIQRINERVGIRSITTEGTSLRVNHKPVRLHGVCLNEIDPKAGRALSYKERRLQLEMMKAAHINFIRTAHYPFGPDFLQLCDEMGFYVCCEVPFGHGDENLTNPDFLPELLSRADATLRRDKNHPSVIIWSLGNENPYTSIVEEVIKFVKQKDPSRPRGLPQTGGYFMKNRHVMSHNVDIYMPHYLAVDKLNEAVKDTDKPIILTEYAHSHGLSFDELEHQYSNLLAHPKIAGGSIWCWADQGIMTYGRNVSENQLEGHYKRATGKAIQGVWLDSTRYMDSNDYAGTDGIVYADGYPQEDYFIVRKAYSPVILSTDSLKGETGKSNIFTMSVENRFDFISLHGYVFKWSLRNIHHNLSEGNIRLQAEARTAEKITIPIYIPKDISFNDLMLCTEIQDIYGKSIYEKNIPINLIGHEKDYRSEIFSMQPEKNFKTKCTKDMAQATAGKLNYAITHEGILQITDMTGKSLINSPLYLRVGRHITTNLQYLGSRDTFYWNPYLLSPTIQSVNTLKEKDHLRVVLECQWNRKEKPGESLFGTVVITIFSNGIIELDYDLRPSKNATGKLLECGLTLQMPSSFDVFQWIGYGPYTHTPGKTVFNERDYWALHRNDIRFTGNKGLVDIGVITDGVRGLGCWSDNGNMAVETIDGKIHLSQNAIISGYGSKFTQPKGIHPIKELTKIQGAMILFIDHPVHAVPLLEKLFKPYKTVVPEQPYFKSYGW